MHIVYIGLGTNLGDLEDNLEKAKTLIVNSEIEILRQSSILKTKPVDYLDQPDFLNQIIKVSTMYSPDELMGALKNIEKNIKRKKTIPKGYIYRRCILFYFNKTCLIKNTIMD